MDKFLYLALFMASSFMIGASAHSGWMVARLWKWTKQPKFAWFSTAAAGFIVTNSVLLWALAPVSTTPSNPRAWFFLLGTALTGSGILGINRTWILNQFVEAEAGQHDTTHINHDHPGEIVPQGLSEK